MKRIVRAPCLYKRRHSAVKLTTGSSRLLSMKNENMADVPDRFASTQRHVDRIWGAIFFLSLFPFIITGSNREKGRREEEKKIEINRYLWKKRGGQELLEQRQHSRLIHNNERFYIRLHVGGYLTRGTRTGREERHQKGNTRVRERESEASRRRHCRSPIGQCSL